MRWGDASDISPRVLDSNPTGNRNNFFSMLYVFLALQMYSLYWKHQLGPGKKTYQEWLSDNRIISFVRLIDPKRTGNYFGFIAGEVARG